MHFAVAEHSEQAHIKASHLRGSADALREMLSETKEMEEIAQKMNVDLKEESVMSFIVKAAKRLVSQFPFDDLDLHDDDEYVLTIYHDSVIAADEDDIEEFLRALGRFVMSMSMCDVDDTRAHPALVYVLKIGYDLLIEEADEEE
jgi:hypothetical protein